MASIIFGKYEPIEPDPDPNLVDMEWLDKDNNPIGVKKINYIEFSDIPYGEKLKVKIKTDGYSDGTPLWFSVYMNDGEKETDISDELSEYGLQTKLKVKNNEAVSELFHLPITLYREDKEEYTNGLFRTVMYHPQQFYIKVYHTTSFKKDPKHLLKPYTYMRNYEELVGLFKTDSSGDKPIETNYENVFIEKDPAIKAIVDGFVEIINDVEKIADEETIKKEIEASARALWEAAVKRHQHPSMYIAPGTKMSGMEYIHDSQQKIDDRPLYWARNKMQVNLKRHPIYKKHIDYDNSLPIVDSVLAEHIKIFEEQSRNYTGIDFSKAAGKKKILISGYDPFVLDPKEEGNILQSNPSGCVALSLHGKTIGDYYIQTFIYPVRYKDFDDGYAEDYFKKYVKEFKAGEDIIFTMSQGGVFRFDVDRFPCKNRGGFGDNMFCGSQKRGYNSKDFKQLTAGEEFYETTLPYKKMVPDKNDVNETFYIYFNQTFEAIGAIDKNENEQGTVPRKELTDIQRMKSTAGSGSNYLSNEIFYRVAKLRTELNLELQTGHLHLPLIQAPQRAIIRLISNGFRNADLITVDHSPYAQALVNKVSQIIEKIK